MTIKPKKKKCKLCSKVIEFEVDQMPEKCPHCKALYWDKPDIERKLSHLQDIYLVTREKKTLGDMFILMKEIATNIIYGALKSNGKFLDEDQVEDMALETMEKLIRSYTIHESFKINSSFTGYIQQAVLYPLYNEKKQKREQTEISMNSPLRDGEGGGKERTLLDKLSLETREEVQDEYMERIMEGEIITNLIEFMEQTINIAFQRKGVRESLILMTLLNHFFQRKSPHFFDQCWEFYPYHIRNHFDKVTIVLKQFITDSVSEE